MKWNMRLTNAWALRYNTNSEECYDVAYVNLDITPTASKIKFRDHTDFIHLPEYVTGIESSFFNEYQNM